jgi:hypothetical protein
MSIDAPTSSWWGVPTSSGGVGAFGNDDDLATRLASRTRKRHRDNRPDEDLVHRTLPPFLFPASSNGMANDWDKKQD